MAKRLPRRSSHASHAARAAIVATLSALIACAGCSSLDGLSGGGDGPSPAPDGGDGGRDNPCAKNLDDDHDNCGACGMVCGGMEHCLAGKCAPGCPDHVVYVSADGNDNASGCTTTTPKRTIGAALALVKTLGAQKHELHVCRGQYDESVVLDYRVSMLGAYECTTWKRSAGYGSPAFDGINDSVVNGGGGVPFTVESVDGVTIDGLSFHAKDGTTKTAAAVLAQNGAKVSFANVRVTGGGGMVSASPASAGIVVDTTAFVDLTRSIVAGGTAQNVTVGGYGSAGVFVTSKGGGVHIADSQVSGGGGIVSGGTGSVGVLALGASLASIIERSSIDGGTGRTGAGSASYGIGFFSGSPADLTITGSTVNGGAGSCSGACAVTGVSASATGKVVVTANRISGGEAKPDLVDDIGFNGIRLTDFATADVQNNFVFSGNTKRAFSSGGVTLAMARGGTALVANNTLSVGPSATAKGSVLVARAKSGSFVNNLLFNAAATSTAAVVRLDTCDGSRYVVRGNSFAGFPSSAALYDTTRDDMGMACAGGPSSSTVDALEADAAALFGSQAVGGNSRVSDQCGTDSKCTAVAACATAAGCAGAVLATWDDKTAGDVLGKGWKLRDDVPCAIARGGLIVPGLLATDGSGAPRTAPRSIGADERDGSCK